MREGREGKVRRVVGALIERGLGAQICAKREFVRKLGYPMSVVPPDVVFGLPRRAEPSSSDEEEEAEPNGTQEDEEEEAEDAEEGDEEEDQEEGGSPKGKKRARANTIGDSRPSQPDTKGKAKMEPKTLPRDEDG